MLRLIFLLPLFIFTFCNSQNSPNIICNPFGKTIATRFVTPKGFVRHENSNSTYDNYLRNLSLKPSKSIVYTYNGNIKQPDNVYEAVLDIDVGNKDLQQCADAVMRLRAEYLYSEKKYDKIHFDFTNGKKAEFVKYAEGFRYNLKTNTWIKTAAKDYSYKSFRNYMDLVFNYAGSLSLSRELEYVKDIKDIKPGDVFIKGGSPGHAVIVLDVAKNPNTNDIVFMIAQSYMPAQNIHVLKNFNNENTSPWYSINFGDYLKTPEWTFDKTQLMRFKEN